MGGAGQSDDDTGGDTYWPELDENSGADVAVSSVRNVCLSHSTAGG